MENGASYNRNVSAQLSSEGRSVVKCSRYLAMPPPVRVAWHDSAGGCREVTADAVPSTRVRCWR